MKNMFRKIYYLRSFLKFKNYGENLWFSRGGQFLRPEEIEFGSNIFIGRNFHISARNLKFGNNIMIGPNLIIECDNHIFNIVGKSMFETRNQRNIGKVEIENDVWIGANVTILPNITIGEGSVIGAGSVVVKNIPPYTICVGVPAKIIKKRFNTSELKLHLEFVKSKYSFDQILDRWKKENIM